MTVSLSDLLKALCTKSPKLPYYTIHAAISLLAVIGPGVDQIDDLFDAVSRPSFVLLVVHVAVGSKAKSVTKASKQTRSS
jgi:hypothetical protein